MQLKRSVQTVFTVFVIIHETHGQTYEDTLTLFNDTVNKNGGVNICSGRNNMLVDFTLMLIISVDESNGQLVSKGYFMFKLTDETVSWDPENYGGKTVISVPAGDKRMPDLRALNSFNPETYFKSDNITVMVQNDGNITWGESKIFSTRCDLDSSKYPFDEQTCQIEVLYDCNVPVISSLGAANLYRYTEHEEWSVSSEMKVLENYINRFIITIHLKRRSTFLLVNNILPVVVLSFINLLVFVVPSQSEEKLNYGITVLLTLFVYLGKMTETLPQSSGTILLINIYIGILTIISVLSLIVSTIIVRFDYLEKKNCLGRRATEKLSPVHRKADTEMRNSKSVPGTDTEADTEMRSYSKSVPGTESVTPTQTDEGSNQENNSQAEPTRNKCQFLRKHIDLISFSVFFAAWLLVTITFTILLIM